MTFLKASPLLSNVAPCCIFEYMGVHLRFILKYACLLYKFRMTECKLGSTPLDRNPKLNVDLGIEECELTQYRQLIGSLIYLTITRPDPNYSVGLLNQFM